LPVVSLFFPLLLSRCSDKSVKVILTGPSRHSDFSLNLWCVSAEGGTDA